MAGRNRYTGWCGTVPLPPDKSPTSSLSRSQLYRKLRAFGIPRPPVR